MLKKQAKALHNNFIFRNQKGGYLRLIYSSAFKEAMVKAGLAPTRIYDGNRHLCARQLKVAEAPLGKLKDLLVYSDRKMTRRYARA
tara:strand:- start:427 stop:684 length:258 start_codon:yes stop_codon:yes gene_type:complete